MFVFLLFVLILLSIFRGSSILGCSDSLVDGFRALREADLFVIGLAKLRWVYVFDQLVQVEVSVLVKLLEHFWRLLVLVKIQYDFVAIIYFS